MIKSLAKSAILPSFLFSWMVNGAEPRASTLRFRLLRTEAGRCAGLLFEEAEGVGAGGSGKAEEVMTFEAA